MFGVLSAAYQIEGAWNIDGKGPSIWDEFTHSRPEKLFDRQNGDIAANSYLYYMDDVDLVKNLSVKNCYHSESYFMDGILVFHVYFSLRSIYR